MEPIKFDKNLKDLFRRRKLQPTDEAWVRLEKLLNSGEQNKKRNIWAYGTSAAAVAGIIVLSIWKFGTTESQVQPAVINDFEASAPEYKDVKGYEGRSKTNVGQLPSILKDNQEVVSKERVLKDQLTRGLRQSKLLELENRELGNKVEIVVLSKNDIQTRSDTNREAEADSLLSVARHEMAAGSNNGAGYRIDANELLMEAENELDHSFREQVLDKLKDGYKKVKGTLADRNN